MSDKINDGGDAFPAMGNPNEDQFLKGMSLRDWYAGMALQGMMANGLDKTKHHVIAAGFMDMSLDDGAAAVAYMMADAMIKARGIA